MLSFNSDLYRKYRSTQRTAIYCPLPENRDLVVTLRTSDGVTRGNVSLNGRVLCLIRGAPPNKSKLRRMLRRSQDGHRKDM